MGPSILITIGVLFLLDQMGHQHWMEFGFTWPALLIVIGLVILLERSASIRGHVPREYGAMPPGQFPPGTAGYPGYPPQPQGTVTPPPNAPAGFITPGQPGSRPDDKGGA